MKKETNLKPKRNKSVQSIIRDKLPLEYRKFLLEYSDKTLMPIPEFIAIQKILGVIADLTLDEWEIVRHFIDSYLASHHYDLTPKTRITLDTTEHEE